ncbi:hypothetical protein [Roseiconus lacunae]|uniref:hypothetical protein n=1 Tax=Roseiconus lacunae TaxID=2605694 RepID=UPI0011F1A61A|nr:hypothetical protein [Roseiconus lacunae]
MSFYEFDDLESLEDQESRTAEVIETFQAIIDDGVTGLSFRDDPDNEEFEVSEIVRTAEEYKTLDARDKGCISFRSRSFQLVSPKSDMAHAAQHQQDRLRLVSNDGVVLSINYSPLPVGVYASEKGLYNEYVVSPLGYCAVEVDFAESKVKPSEIVLDQLIDRYLFGLAASHEIVFERSEFFIDEEHGMDWWEAGEEPDFPLRPLDEYNEGVRLYVAAVQVTDPELRLFSLYKVLEYFGPCVKNLDSHESLRKKLDRPEALQPTGQFLREILSLAKDYEKQTAERDLIKRVLLTGTDLPGLLEALPDKLKRGFDGNSSKLEKVARDVADAICSTRNYVAHAKANYSPTGTECAGDDLLKLNQFVAGAAQQLIRWYNRLPEHLKNEIHD